MRTHIDIANQFAELQNMVKEIGIQPLKAATELSNLQSLPYVLLQLVDSYRTPTLQTIRAECYELEKSSRCGP